MSKTIIYCAIIFTLKKGDSMKKHSFFAWMAVICLVLAIITGYNRKNERIEGK